MHIGDEIVISIQTELWAYPSLIEPLLGHHASNSNSENIRPANENGLRKL